MIDVLHSSSANDYVDAVREAFSQGDSFLMDELNPPMRCPECGRKPSAEPLEARHHRMIGPYVIVGCEGYFTVNPNLVGIPSKNWEAAR